jgi:hypothetical protein
MLTLVLSPLAAPAQEYAVKLAKPGPGDQFQVKSDNNTDVEIKALDAGGQAVFEKKEAKTHHFVYREVGLERGPAGSDLVRLKRTYKKAFRTIDGDRRTLPFQGETVLIEKKGGAFEFRIEDGETLEGEDVNELHEEFNKGGMRKLIEVFLPRKAVKVNEPWTVDAAKIAKEFSKDGKIKIDPDKSTGTGKLLKAYQKSGKQFGVLEVTVNLPVTHLDHEGNLTPTKQGKFVIKVESEGPIDGSIDQTQTKVSFDGEVRADVTVNGMDLTLDINIHGQGEDQRTPVGK